MSKATPFADRSLASRVKGGSAWGGLNIALSRLLQFATTIIVARIIAPEEFGALAVALVAQTIALNIAELGTTAALARGDRDPDSIAPTVFTLSLITSTTLTALMVATAPSLATALGDPSAAPVVQVMAVSVFLAGFSSVPTAMVWRDFLQKKRLAVDLTSIIVTLLLVVPLALVGWGAMALAVSRVVGQAVSTVGYWIITPRRYWPGWNSVELPHLLRLGVPLALSNLVVFVTLNVDYIVVGRTLGPEQLGLYLLAFNLAALPSSVITVMIRTVAIPAFGRLHAIGALGTVVSRLVRGVAWVAFPISALIGALGTPLMDAVYGDQWVPAAVALVGLSVFGAARILSELFADLCVGAGKTVGLFWVQVVWLLTITPAMVVAVAWWGIAGAGYAHAVVGWFVVVPAYLIALSRAIDTRWYEQVAAFLPVAAASVLAAVAAWYVAGLIENIWLALLAGGAAGGLLYVLLTLRVARSVIANVRDSR